jgi:hypothetical protein
MSNAPRPPRQPPDPADLGRYPPRDPICGRIRTLCRDYADGELEDVERNLVDLHVHRCRECGLALARAEHEVLRLRRAGAEHAVAAPAGFAGRTLQRLLGELGREPAPGTEPVAPRASGARLLGALLLAAALLLVAVLLFSAYGEVERRSRAVVDTASRAFWETGSGAGLLAPGQAVPEGAVVRVDPSGLLWLKWQVQAGRRQPSAALVLHGGSRMRVEGAEPCLLSGAAGVEVHRGIALQVGDGSRVELDPGRYHLDAVEFRTFDELANGRGPSLRVRLETLAGEGARVLRGSQSPVHVASGEVARWQGWTAVVVEPAVDVQAAAAAIRAVGRAPAPPADALSALAGTVFERPAGTPSGGVRVDLRFAGTGGPSSWQGETDAAGAFRVPPGTPVEGGFAVVRLLPPPGRADLAVPAPQVLPVERIPTGARISQALALEPAPEIRGMVVDADQRGLAGVRVLPCLIDEVFGCVLPMLEGEVASDARGQFSVRGLPVSLPPHQRLGLLLLHPGHASRCRAIPAPGSLAALEFSFQLALDGLVPATVQGLRPEAAHELLEELQGLPPGTAVRVHRVVADGSGQAMVRTGGGNLWLREGTAARAQLRWLQRGRVWQPEPTVQDAAQVFAPLLPIPGTDFLVSRTFRGERFAAGSAGGTLSVGAVSEITGRPLPGAQIYALVADGPGGASARLLGIEDGGGALDVGLHAGEVLVAVAEDGSLGIAADLDPTASGARVPLREPGTLLVGEGVRPRPEDPRQVVGLRLVRRSGPLRKVAPTLIRFVCGTDGWVARAVPAGEYDVHGPGGRSWTVQVQPGQTLALR